MPELFKGCLSDGVIAKSSVPHKKGFEDQFQAMSVDSQVRVNKTPSVLGFRKNSRRLAELASKIKVVNPCSRPFSGVGIQTSTSASSAFSWMNSRLGSTSSPISRENMSSASSAWLTFTCSRVRAPLSRVVSQSCSGFISPRPL